ncbi:hypothetical protein HPB49_022615 [Dermacentor silvarum]|uniref:Uncharacterized protein n=1 Tax=Dermacentor silvarum TaxID=543639 RepID=A0ACB8DQY8_DERSI|nr:hypothetical protein HPB49_022615 [Dermacentor silvarum]
MASIDIAKTFDKIVHPAILRGMKQKGVSEDFVSTEHGPQENILQLETFLEKRSLKANAAKSSSLVILRSGRDHKSKICPGRKFRIYGEEMASESSVEISRGNLGYMEDTGPNTE